MCFLFKVQQKKTKITIRFFSRQLVISAASLPDQFKENPEQDTFRVHVCATIRKHIFFEKNNC